MSDLESYVVSIGLSREGPLVVVVVGHQLAAGPISRGAGLTGRG